MLLNKFKKYTDTRGRVGTGLATVERDGNASMVYCNRKLILTFLNINEKTSLLAGHQL